ncbi:MAG: hypothetical protein ACYC63_12675 [Armatimonadota bacterium]
MRWHLLVAGLVLAVLLCYDLGGRELWTDEGYSLSAGGPLPDSVFGDASHPPGYLLLLRYWLLEDGRGDPYYATDGWLRAFGIPWALLAWWLGWVIAARLGLKKEGLLAAWLMAVSPLVLTYFRIGRYYSMAAALTMLCLLALVWLWERPGWWRGLVLGLTAALVGYTDYTALVLILAIFCLSGLLSLLRRDTALLYALGGAAATASLLMAPLALMTVQRAATVAAITADPMAHSLRGVIIKLALPVFSLATGECVDPWRWAITVPAVVVTVVLLVAGLASLWRRQRIIALAWPLNVIIATLMLTTVAANVPPNRVTSLAMFTIPLAYLLVACGALRFRRRWLSAILLLPLLVAYGYGLSNYFQREQLLNEGYAPPWREVAAVIEQHEQPGDIILSAEDVFGRYYDGTAHIGTETQLRETIEGEPPTGRLWLIVRDRGSQPLLLLGLKLREVLTERGYTEQVFNIQPRTPTQQRMLSMVLRRPAADAYVKVYLLEKRERGTRNRELGRP